MDLDSSAPKNGKPSKPTRRTFMCLSLAAGYSVIVSDIHGQTSSAENDAEITKRITAADTIALYTNLLDEVRRLVLRRDAERIFAYKIIATNWLSEMIEQAQSVLGRYPDASRIESVSSRQEILELIRRVASGGRDVHYSLVQLRKQPLDEIKRLDIEFDVIRSKLLKATYAIKKGAAQDASNSINAAIQDLNKYSTSELDALSAALQTEYQTRLITPSRLIALLNTVRETLESTATPRAEMNHSVSLSAKRGPRETLVQRTITSTLQARLNPASWIQLLIGYSVTFPILIRVNNRENRIKLLNDALRLVPPGLRDPLLSELANELAAL